MIDNKIENFDRKTNLKAKLDYEQTQEISITSQSETQLEHERNKILLEDSQNKNIFLSKISLVFIGYFLFINVQILYIQQNPDDTRLQYIHSKLNVLLYIYLIVSFGCKILFSLIGSYIRKLAPIFFFIDLYFTYMIVLGLYYKFSISGVFHSGNSANIVHLISFVMLFNFIAFFLSTIFKDNTKVYNPYIGIALILLAQSLSITYHKLHNTVVPLSQSIYLRTYIALFLIDIYICLNSYLIVNYRTSKFYESDIFYCTNCYWGDWLNNIWIDIIKTNKQLNKENQQLYIENKKSLKLQQSQELQEQLKYVRRSQRYKIRPTDLKINIKKEPEFN